VAKVPEPGAGLLPWPPGALRVEAGARLDGRLRAALEAGGIRTVKVRPPFAVALAVVGSEIVDAAARASAGQREDLTSSWLVEAIAGLGLTPLPLGIIEDSPGAVRDAILHTRGRADVLIFAGGIGQGVTDRTVEGIQRFEAHFHFDGVTLEGATGLFLAKTLGIDLLGIGGRPLEAAAAFDLFLRPALLARLGAPPAAWDWSLASRSVERAGSGALAAPPPWAVHPASLAPAPPGEAWVRILEPGSPFLPFVPGQTGWAVVRAPAPAGPPEGEPGPRGGGARAYFQPLGGG
jgi:molybdopterin molybdotransferase